MVNKTSTISLVTTNHGTAVAFHLFQIEDCVHNTVRMTISMSDKLKWGSHQIHLRSTMLHIRFMCECRWNYVGTFEAPNLHINNLMNKTEKRILTTVTYKYMKTHRNLNECVHVYVYVYFNEYSTRLSSMVHFFCHSIQCGCSHSLLLHYIAVIIFHSFFLYFCVVSILRITYFINRTSMKYVITNFRIDRAIIQRIILLNWMCECEVHVNMKYERTLATAHNAD